jgi:uncharacterized SAM-binding protein YcdF (DUF218 family)
MFFLKKIFSRLFFPLSLILELMVIGLLWPSKRKKFFMAGFFLLYLFSFDPFADLLLWPLERTYSPVNLSSLRRDVKLVVVLGGGVKENPSLTSEDRLYEGSLKRLLEGVRLCRHLPKARLILSGGDYLGETPVAQVMKEAALGQGLPLSRLIQEEYSWDTHDEALILKKTLGSAPFYLVISASHMPRSMALFKKAGTNPLAAPTDFQALWGPLQPTLLFPKAEALLKTEKAFYEYLGLLWGWLRGYL